MRPITISLTGNGATAQTSAPVPLDWRGFRSGVTLALDTNGSTTAFTVEYSVDDPEGDYTTDYNTDGKWFTHPDFNAVTADTIGNIAFPVRAVRLRASASGTDVGTLTIIQGD